MTSTVKQLRQRANQQSSKVHTAKNMQVELLLAAIIVRGLGQALVPATSPSRTAVNTSTESQPASKLQAIEKRYMNKTVDMSEIQRYASALYSSYAHDMQKSIKYFQELFGPHIRNGTNTRRKLRNCSVQYNVKHMGRASFPKRIKVGQHQLSHHHSSP